MSITTLETTASRTPTTRPAAVSIAAPYVYLGLGCLTFLVLAATFMALVGYSVVDDTFIVLIYARSLADGAGLLYTDGTRVEGFTDPLWVLIGAGAFKLGIDPIVVFRVVGIGSGLGLILAVWAWSRRLSAAPPAFQIAPLLVAAIGPVAYWAIGGLETTTFAALAFTGTLLAVNAKANLTLAGIVFFLAALTHPDAVVLLAPVLVYVLLKDGRRDFSSALTLLLSFAIPFAIYWLARWAYFGEFMPNTFEAKSTFSYHAPIQALFYLLRFSPAGVLLMPVLLGIALRRGLSRDPVTKLLMAQLVLWLAYVAYAGGDFMPLFRFFVPLAPILALLLQESAWTVWRTNNWRAPGLVFIGLVVIVTTLGWVGHQSTRAALVPHTEGQGSINRLGKWMASNTTETDVIAVSAAGAVPYFSQRAAIDMLGLNDKYIAHHGYVDYEGTVGHKRYDAGYVLDRSPEIIVLNLIEEDGESVIGQQINEKGNKVTALASNNHLFQDPRFWAGYSRVLIPDLEKYPVIFVRNDRAAQMVEQGIVTYSPFKEVLP